MTIEIMSALTAPTIAALGAYIAWRQYATSRQKLKLELYDRHFKVYAAVRDTLRKVISKVTLDIDDMSLFYAETAEAEFLFDARLVEYLGKVKDRVIELRIVNRKLEDGRLPVGDERSHLAEKDAELLGWFSREVDEVARLLRRYLSVSTIR